MNLGNIPRPVLSQGLIGLGAGLLASGPTVGDRLSRGIIGMQKGMQAGRQQNMNALKMKALKAKLDRDKMMREWGMGLLTGDGGSPTTPPAGPQGGLLAPAPGASNVGPSAPGTRGLLADLPAHYRMRAVEGALSGDIGAVGEAIGDYRESQREAHNDLYTNERKLSKEYDSAAEPLREALGAAEKVYTGALRGSGPGDVAVITKFMNVLDPGSVVREGEFMTAERAAGYRSVLENVVDKINKGTRLTPEARREFVEVVQDISRATEKAYGSLQEHYRGLANEYGFSPDRIVRPTQYSLYDWDLNRIYDPSAGNTDPKPGGKVSIPDEDDEKAKRYLEEAQRREQPSTLF